MPLETVKPVTSNNPVLHLYISCYVTVNKLCSAVVPIVAPSSTVVTPIRLYPLYCTLYLCTLTRQQLHVLVALSSAFVSDISIQILQCALYWLQLNKCFLRLISLRNQQTFFQLRSFSWKLAVATTALNCEHVTHCSYFSICFAKYLTLD
jgi:hypothetical protein